MEKMAKRNEDGPMQCEYVSVCVCAKRDILERIRHLCDINSNLTMVMR